MGIYSFGIDEADLTAMAIALYDDVMVDPSASYNKLNEARRIQVMTLTIQATIAKHLGPLISGSAIDETDTLPPDC